MDLGQPVSPFPKGYIFLFSSSPEQVLRLETFTLPISHLHIHRLLPPIICKSLSEGFWNEMFFLGWIGITQRKKDGSWLQRPPTGFLGFPCVAPSHLHCYLLAFTLKRTALCDVSWLLSYSTWWRLSNRYGSEASWQQTYEWAILEVSLPAPVKQPGLTDDSNAGWHLTTAFLKDAKPEPLSRVASKFQAHSYELINMYCWKPPGFRIYLSPSSWLLIHSPCPEEEEKGIKEFAEFHRDLIILWKVYHVLWWQAVKTSSA